MDEKPPLLPNKDHLQLNFESKPPESPKLVTTNGNTTSSDNTPLINNTNSQITTTNNININNKKPFISNITSVNNYVKSGAIKYHLAQGNISKESSVSSCLSDATTASSMTPTSTISDKPKTKILANGTKHTTLKRVSFGSSKGSMVETLIYESPLQEEPENSPIAERPCPSFPSNTQESTDSTELERSKVRVSFFQQSRPQQISPINSTENLLHLDIDMASTMTATPPGPLSATATITDINGHLQYNRQESTDSGWDNPFRPGGELSREAEEIVELIKGGKPITPTPDSSAPPLPSADEADHTIHSGGTSPTATPASTVDATSPLTQSPRKTTNLNASPNNKTDASANGNAGVNSKQPGSVDIKRDTMNSPGEAEHVVLKKKPKCKCCVIQ